MNRYAWILTSFCLAKARAWIETKEIGTNHWILAIVKQINQKQLILVQGVDSKKGQLIYLTWNCSFQVILYKMIRFLSGKLKKHTKLTKIVKKIGPSGLSCFKDMDICHVISCTSCESKGDFVEHLSCYKLHQLWVQGWLCRFTMWLFWILSGSLMYNSNYWTTKNLVFEFLYFYDLTTYLNDLAT